MFPVNYSITGRAFSGKDTFLVHIQIPLAINLQPDKLEIWVGAISDKPDKIMSCSANVTL